MPAYMVPENILVRQGPLPRNPNGKIDRKALASEFVINASPVPESRATAACPPGTGK